MTAPVDNMSSPDFRGGRREGKSCAAQRHRFLFAGCDNSERGEVAAGAAPDARVGWLARATSARLPDAQIRRGQTVQAAALDKSAAFDAVQGFGDGVGAL